MNPEETVAVELTPKERYLRWANNRVKHFARESALKKNGTKKKRDADLPAIDNRNLYGCVGLVDPCGERDVISLSMAGGNPFLDALGWRTTDVCRKIYTYITWAGAAELAGLDNTAVTTWTPAGIITECCDPRPGIAWGACEYELNGFTHLGRNGGTTCLYDMALRECENSPRIRIDGTQIDDDHEWRAVVSMEALMGDMMWTMINGDKDQDGQTDGLEALISTGVLDYKGQSCPGLDSIVVNWNDGCYATADRTWTDARGNITLTTGLSIVDVLKWIVRNIRQRIKMSPSLRAQTMRAGDQWIVGNSNLINCLLDCMTCYRMCNAGANALTVLYSREGQDYRNMLTDRHPMNIFGDGRLELDGVSIPLLIDDSFDDLYFLTVRVGNIPVMWAENQDMRTVVPSDAYLKAKFTWTDGGKFMHYVQTKETCVSHTTDFRYRLNAPGRFLSARIAGFQCEIPNVIPGGQVWRPNFITDPTRTPYTTPAL